MNYGCKLDLNEGGMIKKAAWIGYILVTSIWNKKIITIVIVLAWPVS